MPDQSFQDGCFQAANALRLITHGIGRKSTAEVSESTVIIDSFQVTITFAACEDGVMITVDPKPGIDDGHKYTQFFLRPEHLPGSELFTTPYSAMPELFGRYVEGILANGAMSMFSHDGHDHCVLFSPAQGSRAVVAQYVEAIGRGIDAKYDPCQVYMRHPGFGVSAVIEMITPEGEVATPSPEDEDAERRACAARLHMAKRWVHHLPQAIIVHPTQLPNLFFLTPHAMTFAAPEDRSVAMSNAIRAYMHLAEISQK